MTACILGTVVFYVVSTLGKIILARKLPPEAPLGVNVIVLITWLRWLIESPERSK